MAPNRDQTLMMINNNNNNNSSSSSDHDTTNNNNKKVIHNKQLSRLSVESLQRTISDISLELITKQALNNRDDNNNNIHHNIHNDDNENDNNDDDDSTDHLEEATCECCGMAEEATCEYVGRVRAEFNGRVVCGLCAEAVGEEMRSGPHRIGRDEALVAHMKDCARFTRLGRTHPALFQAEAIKVILKKTTTSASNPVTPRDFAGKGILGNSNSAQRISRSSSCIPAIRKDVHN